MKKISLIAVLGMVIMSSCKESFKKGLNGLEYKLISSGSGDKLKNGEFMQLAVVQLYNNGKADSVLQDSRENPQGDIIDMFDTTRLPKEYATLFSQMRKGDSLVIRVLTDSIFKESPMGMPEMFKKGRYMTSTIKLVNIFKTSAEADSARVKSMELAQVRIKAKSAETRKAEDKQLAEYFKKNNITVNKSPLGTYVQILQPGTGTNADTSKFAVVNYTGKTLAGEVFDSNTDPAFQHVMPLYANLTADKAAGGNVIEGWKDGFLLLNKGAKAKFYIPSELGYGAMGSGPKIAPNTILVFDVELTDLISKESAVKAMNEMQQKMQEEQMRVQDSIIKANKATMADTAKAKK